MSPVVCFIFMPVRRFLSAARKHAKNEPEMTKNGQKRKIFNIFWKFSFQNDCNGSNSWPLQTSVQVCQTTRAVARCSRSFKALIQRKCAISGKNAQYQLQNVKNFIKFCPKVSPDIPVELIPQNHSFSNAIVWAHAHSSDQNEHKMVKIGQKCKFSKIFGKILHKTCTHMISSSPIHGFVTQFQTPSPIIARFYTLKVLMCRKRCKFGPKTFKIDSKMSKFCPKIATQQFCYIYCIQQQRHSQQPVCKCPLK